MDCLSAISLLCFQIVCINIKAISSDQKQQLADTLDRLLKFPGWMHINDRAKYQNAAGEIESFSGRDLYAFDLNEEYDASMENRIVHVKNVDKKYDMIVHLLGCVYTKVMLTFLNLLHVAIAECQRVKVRCRNNAGRQVTRDCARLEIHLTSEERVLVYKDLVDYENFKTVFDTVLGLLENHYLMLDFMSTALRYLIGLAPLQKGKNELMQDLQTIRADINGIQLLRVHMSSGCFGCSDDDEKYARKLKILSDKVSKTMNIKKGAPLVKFKNNYCILPDNEQWKKEHRIDINIIIEEMKKLENEVFTSFYQYLGFLYDNQATILRPDNIQNVVDDDVNNSDLVPNVTIS